MANGVPLLSTVSRGANNGMEYDIERPTTNVCAVTLCGELAEAATQQDRSRGDGFHF